MTVRALILTIASIFALIPSAQSQMVTGPGMENFREAFALRQSDITVRQLDCTLGANVFWPGETARMTFLLQSKTPFKGKASIDIVDYGTRSKPGDMWKPVVFTIADAGSTRVDLEVSEKGTVFETKVAPGDRFGGYAVVFDFGDRGRVFGCACVRAVRPKPGRIQLPTYAMDLPWPHEMSKKVYNVFSRLGVKGARVEGGYNTITDAHIDWAMENDLTLMLTVGCGGTPGQQQPLGRGRPWLSADGKMIEGVKEDLAWLPSFDDEFQKYLTGVVSQYGWPKGPINAVELWNEPWEGVSISGWGADCLRYREIYTHMAQAVLDARKQAGVKVLIGGACSSSNTRDKLFCDGSDQFLPILDFVSIHYQPLGADPALVPQWIHRAGEYGPVQCWDTESWVANSEDRVAAVIASMRAMGQQRTAGIYRGNIYESEKHNFNGKEYSVVQVWSPGAAVAATQSFIGQRSFREILFKNGLPWVFVFDGLPKLVDGNRAGDADPDDGTVVIVGNLGASYPGSRVLFRSVGIDKQAKMTIANPDKRFVLVDFYGNPVPAAGDTITVPINEYGYFLRSDGSAGSFARLLDAIRSARIEGFDPVQIVAYDMTVPLSAKPTIRIALTNILNRSIEGKLTASIEGLTLTPSDRPVKLDANQTTDFIFTVTDGKSNADNTYPLLASFECADGKVRHAEAIHVNAIARRSIVVDGNLDDWSGVTPQITSQPIGASDTEKAYLPFRDWAKPGGPVKVTALLAADADTFYFAAQLPKIQPMIRFETRNDDDYFYPETVLSKDQKLTWPQGVRRFSYRKDPDLPAGNGQYNIQIAFNVIPPKDKVMLPFPAGTMPRFCAYPDTDYEYALNQCSDGGTEIFCLLKPGVPRKHFYPRQPKAPIDGGPVKGNAKLVMGDNTIECAIPLSEMPEVKTALDFGKTIKFSFRANQGGTAYELAVGRSVSKENFLTFHNDWSTHWANELEFALEPK